MCAEIFHILPRPYIKMQDATRAYDVKSVNTKLKLFQFVASIITTTPKEVR